MGRVASADQDEAPLDMCLVEAHRSVRLKVRVSQLLAFGETGIEGAQSLGVMIGGPRGGFRVEVCCF